MTKNQRAFVLEEAKEFIPPIAFAGGCKKSSIEDICIHFKPAGAIGKLEKGCPNWNRCKGERFKYNS